MYCMYVCNIILCLSRKKLLALQTNSNHFFFFISLMARRRIIKRLQDNLILSKTNAYKEIYTTKKNS